MQKSTYMPKAGDEDPQWHLIDLDGVILGRAATRIANLLRGKHKPTFTPHHDMGDFVVVVNAEKVKLTGNKLEDKLYHRHSGYRGGIKTSSAGEILEKKPEELIRSAVNGMLPKNGSRKHYLKKLKVYAGTEHPHEAQKPAVIGLNDKEVTAKAKPAKAAPKKTEAKTEAKADAPKKTEAKDTEKAPSKKAPAKEPAAAKTEKKPAKKTEKKES